MPFDFSRLDSSLEKWSEKFRLHEPVYLAEYISPNDDGTHNVYPLEPDGSRGPERAIPGRCRNWPGVIVRLSIDHQRWGPDKLVIVGVDEEGYGNVTPAPSMLEDHGWDHGYNQIDEIMNLYTWQLYPLRVQPFSGLVVRVLPGIYYAGTDYHQLAAPVDVNLAPSLPAAGWAFVTLSIDAVGGITVTKSADTPVPVIEDIPDAPIGERPLCAVLLNATDTSIPRSRFSADLRYMPGGVSSGGSSAPLWENVIIVAKAGGQYDVIQDAIDAASAGDVVLLMPGVYVEDVDMASGVSLVGIDRDTCIVQGPGTTGTWAISFGAAVDGAVVSNLTAYNHGTGAIILLGIVSIAGPGLENFCFDVLADVVGIGGTANFGFVQAGSTGTLTLYDCESESSGAALLYDAASNFAGCTVNDIRGKYGNIANSVGTFNAHYTVRSTQTGTIINNDRFGVTTFGDGGATDYSEFATDGDLTFIGTAGLQFGEIYVEGIDDGIGLAAQDTYYQITSWSAGGAGVDGNANGAVPDVTNDHITITKEGMYLVNWSVSCYSTQKNEYEFEIFTNNGTNPFPNTEAYRTTSVASAVASVSGFGICDFAVNDTVELWVERKDGAGVNKTLTIRTASISVVQIGGT